jgi:hypothetical protein
MMNKEELKAMSEEEVAEYLRDCVATLKILNDSGSAKYEQIHNDYLKDISALYELGRLTEDEYNELKDDAIMRPEA